MELQLPRGWIDWDNSPIVLFHGTTASAATSILGGVDVSKGKPDNDFGRGFYTTTLYDQALDWASRQAVSKPSADKPAIVQLTLDRNALSQLTHLGFVRKGQDAVDYWRFVFNCRQERSHMSGANGYYDVVYGPVAEVWSEPIYRSTFPRFDQISFHTHSAEVLLNDKARCQKEIVL